MDARVLQVSAEAMGRGEWDRWQPLRGGRGEVALVWKGEESHVVKAYAACPSADGARERAALAVLDGAAGTPRLLAESDDPACVVMTRLSGTESLADLLLADGPDRARLGVLGWADALAALHDASTPERCAAFARALEDRAPGLGPTILADDFAEARKALDRETERLGRPDLPAAVATMWTWVDDDAAGADRALREVLAPIVRRDPAELRDRVCVGSREHCVEVLSSYAAAGCSRVYVWPLGDEVAQLERLARDVLPHVG